mmetsp:Transcript_30891/g.73568  ORF Transcript_30891/g.73568 Transcript_30891/m.73568 type:complete len:286 (+) Transcript_30891:867-1724(+)
MVGDPRVELESLGGLLQGEVERFVPDAAPILLRRLCCVLAWVERADRLVVGRVEARPEAHSDPVHEGVVLSRVPGTLQLSANIEPAALVDCDPELPLVQVHILKPAHGLDDGVPLGLARLLVFPVVNERERDADAAAVVPATRLLPVQLQPHAGEALPLVARAPHLRHVDLGLAKELGVDERAVVVEDVDLQHVRDGVEDLGELQVERLLPRGVARRGDHPRPRPLAREIEERVRIAVTVEILCDQMLRSMDLHLQVLSRTTVVACQNRTFRYRNIQAAGSRSYV